MLDFLCNVKLIRRALFWKKLLGVEEIHGRVEPLERSLQILLERGLTEGQAEQPMTLPNLF
jgi:hypothetical protein